MTFLAGFLLVRTSVMPKSSISQSRSSNSGAVSSCGGIVTWFPSRHSRKPGAPLTLESQQICQRRFGRRQMKNSFVRLLSLPEYLNSAVHQGESLPFHKAWPPKPVNEIYLSFFFFFFASARAPCQSFCKSRNMTAATHKSGGNKVWSLLLSSSSSSAPPSLCSPGTPSISFPLSFNQGWSWDGVFKNSAGPGHVWHQLFPNQGKPTLLCYVVAKWVGMRDRERLFINSAPRKWTRRRNSSLALRFLI